MDKIITAIFKVESEGFQALTEIRNAPVTAGYEVSQAALVKKENGQLTYLDSFDTGKETMNDTLRGGLIGALVGILGGPLGVLFGYSIGAIVGSSVDMGDAKDNKSVIELVSEQFQDGEVALIALANEQEGGALTKVFSGFDVSVIEEDAALVQQEVYHAQDVEKELQKEARKKMRADRKENYKKQIEEESRERKEKKDKKKEEKKEKKEEKKAKKKNK